MEVVTSAHLYLWCRLGTLEGTSLKDLSQGYLEGVEGLDWGPSKPSLRGKTFRKALSQKRERFHVTAEITREVLNQALGPALTPLGGGG